MIYFTDQNPETAACNLCDKHLRSTIAFTSKAVKEILDDLPAANNPYIKWVRSNTANLKWLVRHAQAATREVHYRFGKPARVKDITLLRRVEVFLSPERLDNVSPFPNKVDNYRALYRRDFAGKTKWTKRFPPDWLAETNA